MATTLLDFFDRVYLPIVLRGDRRNYATQFRMAIRHLALMLEREPTFSDLTAETLNELMAWLAGQVGPDHINTLRKRLLKLWEYAHRVGFTSRAPVRCSRPISGNSEATLKATPPPDIPEQAPAAGSVWEHFETAYRPVRLIGCTTASVEEFRRTFRFMRRFFGRDLLIGEQTDAAAADYFAWRLQSVSSHTVNRGRACWFAVWRMAHERGLVDRLPAVRKLPLELEEPDAWDPEEASRIILATRAISNMPAIEGIPPHGYFRAMLLIAWWTGLRRGSLWAIAQADVNLESGWLTVRASGMKNKRGKRYKLGPDAIHAIRQIWHPEREKLFPWPWKSEPKRVYKYFDAILKAADVQHTGRAMSKFHKWRRSVATQVAVHGGISKASELLGHSSIQVTLRYLDQSKLPGNDATQLLPSLTLAAAAGNSASCSSTVTPPRITAETPSLVVVAPCASHAPASPMTKRDELRTAIAHRLARAFELLAAGDVELAGTSARIALERQLRFLCLKHRCGLPKKRRGLGAMVARLEQFAVIPKTTSDHLQRLVRGLNRHAHGGAVDPEVTKQLIEHVQAFCSVKSGEGSEQEERISNHEDDKD